MGVGMEVEMGVEVVDMGMGENEERIGGVGVGGRLSASDPSNILRFFVDVERVGLIIIVGVGGDMGVSDGVGADLERGEGVPVDAVDANIIEGDIDPSPDIMFPEVS